METVLIAVEGTKTPMGGRDREDPAGRMPEEASGPPMESEVPGTEINKLIQLLKSKTDISMLVFFLCPNNLLK